MISKLDSDFKFLQTALSIQSQRQSVLASNIANADTPGYKAKDIDFKAALESQLQHSSTSFAMATTQPGHIPHQTGFSKGVETLYRIPNQESIDGNTVNADVEMGKFSENAIQYQSTTSFLQQRIALYKMALQS